MNAPPHGSLPPSLRVGRIGAGVMGASMYEHLLAHQHPSRLYNRARAKAEKLLEGGARCELPAEVVEVADVICPMVGFPREGHDVYLGSNGSIPMRERAMCWLT